MAKIIVYIEGGVLVNATTDSPDMHLMLVDYDNEKEEGTIYRAFELLEPNAKLFQQTLEGIEMTAEEGED